MATEAVENLATDFLQWLSGYRLQEQHAILRAVDVTADSPEDPSDREEPWTTASTG
jgi:hypothetical protein